MMKLLERFNYQKIDRKPDRTTPVGVPAKQPGLRFRRFVIDAMFDSVKLQTVGMRLVITRYRPHAVWREKLLLIKHKSQHPAQPISIHKRKKTPDIARS